MYIIEETEMIKQTHTCLYCHSKQTQDEMEIDSYQKGFWCSWCDGYNFFVKEDDNRKYTLIIEDKLGKNTTQPSSSIPSSTQQIKLDKRLSPLRYPGGKSKLANFIYSKLQESNKKTLISPYTGGASVELALLNAGVIEKLVLNDLDFGVYSLFWTIQNAPYELIDRLKIKKPTHKDYFEAQSLIRNDYKGCNVFDAAWAMLIVNRLAYSGIFKANPLGGRYGTQEELLSRWNPKELSNRIERIHSLSDRFEIYNLDACELIEEFYWGDNVILIDPPYVQKGKQLYRHYYEDTDHIRLSSLLESLYHGFAGADILICYDNDPLILDNFLHPEIVKISRVYSI